MKNPVTFALGPLSQKTSSPIRATSQMGKNPFDVLVARLPTFRPQFLWGSDGKKGCLPDFGVWLWFSVLLMGKQAQNGSSEIRRHESFWKEADSCRSLPDLALGVKSTLTAQQHLALPRHQAIFQTLWGSYSHFAEKQTEAQRVKVTEAELMLLATAALSSGPLRLRGGHSVARHSPPTRHPIPPALPLPHRAFSPAGSLPSLGCHSVPTFDHQSAFLKCRASQMLA